MDRRQMLQALLADYQSELSVLEGDLERAETRLNEILENHRKRIQFARERIEQTELELEGLADASQIQKLDDLFRLPITPVAEQPEPDYLPFELGPSTVEYKPKTSRSRALTIARSDEVDSEKARAIAAYIVERADSPIAHKDLMLMMDAFLRNCGCRFKSNNPSDMASKAFRKFDAIKADGVKGYWMKDRPPPPDHM